MLTNLLAPASMFLNFNDENLGACTSHFYKNQLNVTYRALPMILIKGEKRGSVRPTSIKIN